MKNVIKEQLKKSIFMSLYKFERVVENAIPYVKVSLCYDTYSERTVNKEEIYEELSKYFGVCVTSIHTDSCEDTGVWIVYKDQDVATEVPCSGCYNSRFDYNLTDENDYLISSIGDSEDNYRMLYCSGNGQPPRILFDKWSEERKQWVTVGEYFPKHCPECGRGITEYPEFMRK